MVNAVRAHLLEQQRPLYLQPVDENGRYPWMEETKSGEDGSSNSNSNSKNPWPTVENGVDSTETEMGIWGSGYTMDFGDKAAQFIGAGTSGASSTSCVRESNQDNSQRVPKGLAPKEVDQIKAILRRALQHQEEEEESPNDEDGALTEPGVVWGAVDVIMDQAPGPGESSTSLNAVFSTCTPENDYDDSHKAPKRMASEEVDQIRAIPCKAPRYEE